MRLTNLPSRKTSPIRKASSSEIRAPVASPRARTARSRTEYRPPSAPRNRIISLSSAKGREPFIGGRYRPALEGLGTHRESELLWKTSDSRSLEGRFLSLQVVPTFKISLAHEAKAMEVQAVLGGTAGHCGNCRGGPYHFHSTRSRLEGERAAGLSNSRRTQKCGCQANIPAHRGPFSVTLFHDSSLPSEPPVGGFGCRHR